MPRGKEPTCDEIVKAWKEYEAAEGAIDGPLFDRVGSRIRQQGYVAADDLYLITAWKSTAPWGVSQARKVLSENTVEEIEGKTKKALALVSGDTGEESVVAAVGELDALHQIGVPIASAVLAFYDPIRFGAIDPNAWSALGWEEDDSDFEPEDYGRYLVRIREVAKMCGLRPRQVDAALYQIGGRSTLADIGPALADFSRRFRPLEDLRPSDPVDLDLLRGPEHDWHQLADVGRCGVYVSLDARGAVCYVGKVGPKRTFRDRLPEHIRWAEAYGSPWKAIVTVALKDNEVSMVSDLERFLIQRLRPYANKQRPRPMTHDDE